jgi:hypothetical protein
MAMLSYTKLGNPLPVFAPVHPIIIALTPKHPHPTTTIAPSNFKDELVDQISTVFLI